MGRQFIIDHGFQSRRCGPPYQTLEDIEHGNCRCFLTETSLLFLPSVSLLNISCFYWVLRACFIRFSTRPVRDQTRVEFTMVVPADSCVPGSEDSFPFERAVEAIVILTRAVHRTTNAEETVMKELSAPFSPGRLLVLLERPLATHPWEKGAPQVTSSCPTFELLQQGIRLASNGLIRFLDDVSSLDRWPMHDKARSSKLTTENGCELDRLVLEAITAKRPDVILCMGKVSLPICDADIERL